jgi:predicted RNase H-like HicB family nuclease
MKILVVVERTDSGYSAFAPDVPGCVATGPSQEDVERSIRDAIEFHFEGLRAEGIDTPEPQSYATTVEVAA